MRFQWLLSLSIVLLGASSLVADEPRQAPTQSSGFIVPVVREIPSSIIRPAAQEPVTSVTQPSVEPLPSTNHLFPATNSLPARTGWKPIGEIGVRVSPPEGDLPEASPGRPEWYSDAQRLQGVGGSRNSIADIWEDDMALLETPAIEVSWAPTELWYRPLYFEDANLERYGYRWGAAQPFVSAAHFFGRVPFMPYLRGAQPARNEIAALGPRRPGSPNMIPTRPALTPSPRGALYQAGATVGGIFIVP